MKGTNEKESNIVHATTSATNHVTIWEMKWESLDFRASRSLNYRVVPLPWPLSPRDILYHGSYIHDVKMNFIASYCGPYSHPALASSREGGYVRAEVKFQGYFGEALDSGRTRLHWL